MRELRQATLLARRPLFAPVLRTCGLTVGSYPFWGVSGVAAGPEFYQPDEEGTPAVIAPAFVGLDVVDLVACNPDTRAMRTRRGIATVLGFNEIDRAFLGLEPLMVYDDAIGWLGDRGRGVVVLDWHAVPLLLRNVRALHCESPATAQRLTEAFERPRPYPPVLVHQGEKR